MKNTEIALKLKKHFSSQAIISTQEIKDSLCATFPNVAASTISWRINQLKTERLIQQVGRGLYSFDFKPEYHPEISLKTKRIYNKAKDLCELEMSIWDTQMLDAILGKPSERHWIFLTVAKEALEPLFDQMLDFSKPVFLQPDTETTHRYIIPLPEAILLIPLISETPTDNVGGYLTPTIEGMLVNAWLAADNYLTPIGYDLKALYEAAFSTYNINQSKLLRFSTRRDRRAEIEKLIKSITP